MTTPSPTMTSSPIVTNGPTATFAPSFAVTAIDARGEMPSGRGRRSKYFATTLAIAKYGLPTRMKRSSSPCTSAPTRMAPARVEAICAAYFGLDRKLSCASPASARGATPSTVRPAGPP